MSIGSGPSLAGGLSTDPCKQHCPPTCPVYCLLFYNPHECPGFGSCCEKLAHDCCPFPGDPGNPGGPGDGGGTCGGPSVQPGGPGPGGGPSLRSAGGAAGGPIGGNPLNWLIMSGPPKSGRRYSSNANPASLPNPRPCPPPIGVRQPAAVPDASSPYYQDVLVTSSNSAVGGCIVTCQDTGVSKVYSCGSGQQRFYFRATGRVTYSASGGFRCIDGSIVHGGTAPGFVPQQTNVGIALS